MITAVGNDYGYDKVFERQVLALGRPGDVLLAISTSGRSPSILNAMQAARERKLVVDRFQRRDRRRDAAARRHHAACPIRFDALIQQVHITAGHIICGLVEERLFPRGVTAVA